MEWKGSDGRFYCNEFCADAGADQVMHVVPKLLELSLRRGGPDARSSLSRCESAPDSG
jgi:hypothetical protein